MLFKKKKFSKERKPIKIWVEQGSEFYNQSFKDFLKIKNIEMYSTFNEGKSVIAERLWKTRFLNIWQLFPKVFMLMC